MLSFLRTLLVLSLIIWLGGIIFFGAVMAPATFRVLVTPAERHLAGDIVTRSLDALHTIGFICGGVFIFCNLAIRALARQRIIYADAFTLRTARSGGARIVLVAIMIMLTAVSQYGITSRMNRIRQANPEMEQMARNAPPRAQFDRLHGYATDVEGAVLALGLVVVFLTAKRLA